MRELTLHHLLTMTHGLAWEENQASRLLNRSEDWVADILRLPMSSEPGARFNYSTGVSHVMSAVLTEATGMSVCEFAHRELFQPLGIDADFWGVDPQGYFSGGHSVSMSAREVARFGQLFLDEGRWQGAADRAGLVGGRLDFAADRDRQQLRRLRLLLVAESHRRLRHVFSAWGGRADSACDSRA